MESGAGGRASGVERRTRAKDFSDLQVWKNARAIANAVYDATARFPINEEYGLSSQMKRSAVSISSNIAEGFNRRGSREFQRFVSVALGSCAELRSLLQFASDRQFMPTGVARIIADQLIEEERMLGALQRSLLAQRRAPSAEPPTLR